MSQSPFGKSFASLTAAQNRRRTTRIDYVAPIVISGRNASGQPYREATETITVSVHGASFKTRQQILIGMQLTVENLLEGVTEKAICIRAVGLEPGQDQHVIAIQLLNPRNVWGVIDPPADWQFAIGANPTAPAVQGDVPSPVTTAALSAATPPNSELDQRSSELVESVLQLLRRQASGILRDTLKEFEDRLKDLEAQAQQRMTQRSEITVAETEVSLNELRQNMLEQITAQAKQTVIFTEDNLRERIAEMFLPRQKP